MKIIRSVSLAFILAVGIHAATPLRAEPPEPPPGGWPNTSAWWTVKYSDWETAMLAHPYRTHPLPFFQLLWLDQWFGDYTQPGAGYYRSYARFPLFDLPPGGGDDVPCEGC